MIDRSGQLWLSKRIGTYRYVIRSYDGVWQDDSPCAWHEYINIGDGSHGRAREKVDGSWEHRRDWSRVL